MLVNLKVLMWKHLVVRVRRYFNTVFELVAPVVLFILLFSLKDKFLDPPDPHGEQYNVQQTEPVELNSIISPMTIFYNPATDFTKNLMANVENYLALTSSDHSFRKLKPTVASIENITTIRKLSDENPDSAIVIFEIDETETTPKKLRYSIRMNGDFKTYAYESSEEIDSKISHTNYGTIYEPFMKLQWAIDSSYIKSLTGTEIPQRIILQEFPYKRSDRIAIVSILFLILHYFCMLSLLVVFVMIVARLTEERINGIQELIKMVGVSNNTLALSHVLNTLPTGLIFSIVPAVLLTVTSVPIIIYTNGFYIFLMLILYFISIFSLACVCSYIPSNTQYTTSIAIFSYILLYVPCHFIITQKYIKTWILPFAGLLPHVPMSWFWLQITFLDLSSGLSFNNIAKKNFPKALPVLYCYFALIAQSIIFLAISWYLSRVKPGPYGQALPWNFLCQPQYWSKTKITPEQEDELEELEEGQDPGYFEPPPKGAEVGIKIINVSKTFGQQRALNNVSLDVYKGEITVLVGHNGAGKTTLMSIITGMFSATEGNVYIEGLDTVTQKGEMHQNLGLCPQHNLFFPELTVLEHVMFFAMLKGVTWSESKASAIELLQRLGLSDKINYKSNQLSGGMKRRLQLACALAGDAHVLVLDEPTSGLDVETRRELWDLVLSLRGSRTVLLSTHFMEEAEALGDRVAALHAGRLRCFATPMHLKRTLGTGYRLSFTTNGMPNETAITSIITSKIPEATVKEVSLNSISYNLPSKSSNKFPKLFNLLESKRYELGINTIGVGVSTLEEVFLKLCSDVTTTFTDDMVDGGFVEPTFNTISGFLLYTHQLLVLLKRQFQYMWSKKISFLLLQIILPILFIILFTHTSNNAVGDDDEFATDKKIALDLNIYDKMDERRVLYDVGDTTFDMNSIENKYPDVTFERTNNVVQSVLRAGFNDVTEYNKYLAGIEFNGTDAKVLFTTVVRHAAPIALNMLSNVLAAQYTDGQITTYNHPVPRDTSVIYRSSDEDEPKGLAKSMLWIWSIVFIILVTSVNAASLPCSERSSGTRHIHIMTGCPPPLHWIATLLGSTILYLLVLVIPTVIAPTVFELDKTTNQPAFLGTYFLILVLGLVTFLSFVYLVTFNFKERGAGLLLVGYVIIFGLLTPAMTETSELLSDNMGKDFTDYLVIFFSFTMPPHTTINAGFKAVKIARFNRLPNVEAKCYMCFSDDAPLTYMLALVGQFIFYMSLVILTEYGLFNSLFDRLFNVTYQPSTSVDLDEMVRAEKAYVDKAIALPPGVIQDAMLVNDIHKNYWRLFRKPCNAVKGISFSVKKGECFGLLGVNGAGKSTTFKMLTASECPTRGNIFANGYFMNKLSGNYLRSLGYCPQFLGLDGFLTGHDNLALLLTLRGLAPHDVTTETKSWIETVGLEKYASRVASSYSGGCSRRLAAAAALCRGGALTLLDEPTAGVDVAARRRVWAAVKRAQPHRSVVITSHSMDEMEALCGRIAIMSWGRIRALGEAAELRATHGAGHAVLLKLATRGQTSDEPDGIKPEVNRLKAALQNRFNCTLKDEHTTRLHYHINDTVRYSELFSALELLKEEFPDLLEDYSVTETTLEEVFLSFAKEEPRDGPTPV